MWIHGKSLADVMNGRDEVHRECVFCTGGIEDYAVSKSLPYTDEHYIKHPNYYCKQRTMIDYTFIMARSNKIKTKKVEACLQGEWGKRTVRFRE